MTAAQLQKILDRAGLSQRGTAKQLGISERQMRRYCSGEASIPKLVETTIKAIMLLRRVLDDEHFGIGLSRDIKEFLGSQSQSKGGE